MSRVSKDNEKHRSFIMKRSNALPKWKREILKVYAESLSIDSKIRIEIEQSFVSDNPNSLKTLKLYFPMALNYINEAQPISITKATAVLARKLGSQGRTCNSDIQASQHCP